MKDFFRQSVHVLAAHLGGFAARLGALFYVCHWHGGLSRYRIDQEQTQVAQASLEKLAPADATG